jgi:NAD(P)-dependent dehydrogenase (short-subunit alcohol dehydrogenase family)
MNLLITGSNRGIGLEAAKQLGEKGHHVFITARNETDKLNATALLNDLGVLCKGFLLDLSSMESIDAFLNAFDEDIDVLINNAVVHINGKPAYIK